MKYLIIYIFLAIIWAIYCAYKTSKFGTLGKMFKNQLMSFLMNLIIFPYSFYYLILILKQKK